MAVEQLFRQAFQWTTQEQGERRQKNGNSENDPIAESADEAEYRANPNRRGCR